MIYNKLILIGIYLFAFVVPLAPFKIKVSVFPVSADFLIVLYLGLVFLLMMINGIERKKLLDSIKEFCHTKLFIAMAVYTIVCIASLVPAVSKSSVILELARFWTYVVLFFAILAFVDKKEYIRNIVGLLVISVFIACIFGLVQYFTKSSAFVDIEEGGSASRAFATFVNPNYWGAFINMAIFPVFMLAVRKVKYYGFLYLLSLLLFLNLVLTMTRGSWAGFALGIFILIIMFNKKLLLPVLAAAPFSLLIPRIRSRVFILSDASWWTVEERLKLWKTGYLMFRDHPILGVGNGNYLSRYGEYIKKYPDLNLGREKYTVHNSYLKILSETGILGFIPFIMLIFFYTKEFIGIWKKPNNKLSGYMAAAFLCSIASYLFQNVSNNMFFIPQVNAFFWIIGALIIVYNKLCFEQH